MCSKLKIKTPERRQCHRSSVFIVITDWVHTVHIGWRNIQIVLTRRKNDLISRKKKTGIKQLTTIEP